MYTFTSQTAASLDGQTVSIESQITAEGIDKREVVLAAAATDVEISINAKVTDLRAVILKADAPVTLKTNVAATPVDTIHVGGGNGPDDRPDVIWTQGNGGAPFSADVTKIFASSVPGATLKIWLLLDPTP